jgi:hypothetical protein
MVVAIRRFVIFCFSSKRLLGNNETECCSSEQRPDTLGPDR